MDKIKILLLAILVGASLCSCRKEREDEISTTNTVLNIKKATRETHAKSLGDDAVDPRSVYVLIFEGKLPQSKLLEWKKAEFKIDHFEVNLIERTAAVHACVVTNVGTLITDMALTWDENTTYIAVQKQLKTAALPMSGSAVSQMPQSHPMFGDIALPQGVGATIGTVDKPVSLSRVTVKYSVAYAGGGANFTLLGASLGSTPTCAYIFPNTNGQTDFDLTETAHYGKDGDLNTMIVGMEPANPDETTAMYGYESDKSQATFLIIKAKYNSVDGYYRLDLLSKEKNEPLALLRNFYYRITITRVNKAGYPTAQEAIDHPNENGLNTTIEVIDPFSHEIITDGAQFLGLSNSELWIYDSYVTNEFMANSDNYDALRGKTTNYETAKWGNGFVATTITYTTDKSWPAGQVTGTNGIRFRQSETQWPTITNDLSLEMANDLPVTRDIIITVPHDFKQGTVTIKIGPMERKVEVKRSDVVSVMGDVLDMGTGFSSAKVDYSLEFYPTANFSSGPENSKPLLEYTIFSAMSRVSTSPDMATATAINTDPNEHVYLHIAPSKDLKNMKYRHYTRSRYGLSECYLTRSDNQARVKVHLVREGFGNDLQDGTPFSVPNAVAYNNAFWRNDQTGERLIIIPFYQNTAVRWSVRVIYGMDFIRITKSHRIVETSVIRTSDAEDYQADETWGTYLQCDFLNDAEEKERRGYNPPNFRVALTSKNTTGKPRYGLILVQVPYARGTSSGSTSSFWVYVRQGEETDYILRPTDYINGKPCTQALKVSPFNLTVDNPEGHPGGTNYTDHLVMNGKAVFTKYPSQIGYLFQHGHNRAIHPTNPEASDLSVINGYTYDYNAPFVDICPDGFRLPPIDHVNDYGSDPWSAGTNIVHSLGFQASVSNVLCADGYCDRINYPYRNDALPPSLEYMKPAWWQKTTINNYDLVRLGPLAANFGMYYVNPNTMAGVFIPNAPYRGPKLRAALPLEWGQFYWGILDTRVDQKIEGIFSKDRKSADRSMALPIRCVAQ